MKLSIALSLRFRVVLCGVLPILLGFIFVYPAQAQTPLNSTRVQTPEWAWMGGSNSIPSEQVGQPGVYGAENQFAESNVPGSRWLGVSWTDRNGKLWLFGGFGGDSVGSFGYLNDLWVFDSSLGAHGEWAWRGGSNTAYPTPPGDYGAEYQFAAPNAPGARYSSVTWTDPNGKLWLFGGFGFDSSSNSGDLNDLWVFDPTRGAYGEWAWMGGSSTVPPHDPQIEAGQPGVYGTEYQFTAANVPGARESAVTWTDRDGRLWLFGGFGFDSLGNDGDLNDLWVFDPARGAHGEWAWMGGSNIASTNEPAPPGVYGTESQFAASNVPGARDSAVTWADCNGRLWLFGGYGADSLGKFGLLNDIWEFDPFRGAHGEWAWMGGSSSVPSLGSGQPGVYGTEYQFAGTNAPGGRYSAVSWTDSLGKLWLFGGDGLDSTGRTDSLNDLWVFDPSQGPHGEWAWMGGSTVAWPPVTGVYGTEYQFAASNAPGPRESAVTWTDPDGERWLFGGYSPSSLLNDLWELRVPHVLRHRVLLGPIEPLTNAVDSVVGQTQSGTAPFVSVPAKLATVR
jgi:N-acetylneuraminic acid mutarotase